MRRQPLGLLSALLLLSSGAAWSARELRQDPGQAQQGQAQQGQAQEGQAQQGQAQEGQARFRRAPGEVSGTVAKADRKTVYLREDSGAIIPLKVEKRTLFEGPNLRGARDLQEGQRVRASIETKGTENIATRIAPDTGAGVGGGGGAGVSNPAFPDPDGPGPDDIVLDERPGVGGSGADLVGPVESVPTEEAIQPERLINPDEQAVKPGIGDVEDPGDFNRPPDQQPQ